MNKQLVKEIEDVLTEEYKLVVEKDYIKLVKETMTLSRLNCIYRVLEDYFYYYAYVENGEGCLYIKRWDD